MNINTVYYLKVAAACFVVRVCCIRAVKMCRCLYDPSPVVCTLCLPQVGACMELVMIKTGFYDM